MQRHFWFTLIPRHGNNLLVRMFLVVSSEGFWGLMLVHARGHGKMEKQSGFQETAWHVGGLRRYKAPRLSSMIA